MSARALKIMALLLVSACRTAPRAAPASNAADSAHYAAMQARGQMVMGVDQYSSAHVFEDLADGGRIVLERPDTTDSAGIATIRAHMRTIADAFTRGDFALPGQVHDQVVPGTVVLAARRDLIRYQALDRPRGGEVRITTTDSTALAAVRSFLAFQRLDHHAAGHEHQP
jgi:hypothetical protein